MIAVILLVPYSTKYQHQRNSNPSSVAARFTAQASEVPRISLSSPAMPTTTLQRVCYLLAATWMIFIFLLSHQHSLPTPALFPGQDKLFHGIFFGILGSFYLGSMPRNHAGYTFMQAGIATMLVGFYGITDEIHQYFVPGRTTELLDIIADTMGGLVVTMTIMRFSRRKPD